jgi:hypothetical protein
VSGEESGVEATDAPVDERTVFESFEDARSALIRSLMARRAACQAAIGKARALRKRDVR